MLDIAGELHRWCTQGRAVAVATVAAVRGSAPRQPGAALAVDAAGTALGSVSGGCVEGAVHELCRAALASGMPVLERFGYSDDDAFAVGLTCGGEIDVLVAPVGPVAAAALAAAASGETVALARVVTGPPGTLGRALLVRPDGTGEGTLGGSSALDDAARDAARTLLAEGRTACTGLPGHGVTLLVECSVPPPRMLVFGAIDFAAALVRAGKFLGYHVTVCDARPVFATTARFPEADEVVVDWPHRFLGRLTVDARTVVCVLTHDAKFDVPLLERALRLPVAYVGAMGSRRTHEARLRLLRDAGVGEEELARLRSPIGLDLGARTPEETALSIAAEIVAVRHGGTGVPLTGGDTPIHHEAAGPGQDPAGCPPSVAPVPGLNASGLPPAAAQWEEPVRPPVQHPAVTGR
ncbi:XdhC family protein [Streptomyces sp. SCA3-4]|uniref:XdhC family protein n=1 Tax=Streptomyces sichuanensis TaxID=2871810 RepID=UPI001CE38DCB|nr:XdhC/CoxI family protein [Streptomyces sichuanensis]MCA6090661.1 XdhC family protein [Streptomyces sichuanensis]